MQANLSNESIIKFLELYESERLIWDPKEKNHKLKHKVHDAWKRISLNMDNISIEELKAKKKSLMATFRPLLKKKKASIKSGSGTDDVFQPIWFAYDTMERFLGTNYEVEDTINTEDEPQPCETVMLPPSPMLNQSIVSDELPPPTLPQECTKKTTNSTIRSNISRKRHNNSELNLDEAQKKINESFETLNHVLKGKRVEEDECDVYAKLLAKRLRKYPEGMRDKLMYKIDGLLLDHPYTDERSSGNSAYYSSPAPSPYYQNSIPSPYYQISTPSSASNVSYVSVPEVFEKQQNQIDVSNSQEVMQPMQPIEISIPERNLFHGINNTQPTFTLAHSIQKNTNLNDVTKY